MPISYAEIPELTTHVFEPVAEQLVHRVLETLQLKDIIKDAIVIDFGYHTPNRHVENSLDSTLKHNRLECVANVNMSSENTKWEASSFFHNTPFGLSNKTRNMIFPLFADTTSRISLTTHSKPCHISLECTFSIIDRTLAYLIDKSIRNRYSGGYVSAENLYYSYTIPNEMLTVLFSLYKLKHDPGPFGQYLVKNAPDVSLDVKSGTDQSELVVLVSDLHTLFQIEYTEDKPAEVRNNRSVSNYEIKFTLHIQFTRPDFMSVDFPIIVDNQLVPKQMIPFDNTSVQGQKGVFDYTDIQNNMHEIVQERPLPAKLPFYDDWVVPPNCPISLYKFKPFIIAAFTIDPTKETTEIDLTGDLGGCTLHPLILEIIKKQDRASFAYEALIGISAFSFERMNEPMDLILTEDLKLIIPTKDIHKVRHFTISELTDINFLNERWYWLLKEYLYLFPELELTKIFRNYVKQGNAKLSNPDMGGIYGSSRSHRILWGDLIARRSNSEN